MARKPGAISIVIADKSPLVLEGLRDLFDLDTRFANVAFAARAEALMDLTRRETFDVAVIGWVLPDAHGRDVLNSLSATSGAPRVVVYTGDPDPTIPRTAMALGGAGFCSKTESPDRLVEIVVAVARGQMVFPFMDVRTLEGDRLGSLTEREFSLVAALADGASNKSLGSQFGVTVNTVKFHLGNAYAKLGARNRAQAVAIFLQANPLQSDRS